MSLIISLIHSGVLTSIIVFWSPNSRIMYFISHLLSGAPGGHAHSWVGAGPWFSTSTKGKPRRVWLGAGGRVAERDDAGLVGAGIHEREGQFADPLLEEALPDRKSTRLNSSHG